MRVRDYSTAVYALIREGMDVERTLTGLTTMLASRGHESLYPKILRELTLRIEKSASHDSARVTVAKDVDATRLKDTIAHALIALDVTEHEVAIDVTITGGFIVQAKECRIDHSHKKQLLTLYRSLIKS